MSRRTALTAAGMAGIAATLGATAAEADPSRGRRRDLRGKVAIVTGARNNLGRGFAVALAEMGADIVVHHHRPNTRDQAEETTRLCRRHGVRTTIFTADLAPPENVRALYDHAERTFGRIDVVVNNAGRIKKAPMAEVERTEFELCLGINTIAMFFSMQEASRRIQNHGRIINIGTSLLNAITPDYAAYAGTKAPMEEFTRMLAREIGHRRVTVNVVAPGAVDTPFFRNQETPESIEYLTHATPAGRLGRVDDIVPMVAYLASSAPQWITGQTVWVNDGYSTR